MIISTTMALMKATSIGCVYVRNRIRISIDVFVFKIVLTVTSISSIHWLFYIEIGE